MWERIVQAVGVLTKVKGGRRIALSLTPSADRAVLSLRTCGSSPFRVGRVERQLLTTGNNDKLIDALFNIGHQLSPLFPSVPSVGP